MIDLLAVGIRPVLPLLADEPIPTSFLPGIAVVYATSTERGPVPAQLLKQMLGFPAAEAEVAYMMADGLSAKKIAQARHVSITTAFDGPSSNCAVFANAPSCQVHARRVGGVHQYRQPRRWRI